MSEGLPLRAPVAVVDLDDSSLSRRVVRNLGSSELVDVAFRASSYAEALELVKSGKAYGFSSYRMISWPMPSVAGRRSCRSTPT